MADDLTSLTEIHEENLISNIKQRYYNNKIYTYIGDILIAVNPYCDLGLYGEEQHHEFTDVRSKQDHSPHIYLVSDRAYQNLKDSGINQCCVVSGESGAGKTESTKFLVEHIAYLCKHDDLDLHEKIIAVNPLLETFGNAQTVINDNSSRFGKFIELVFGRNGNIVGAKISEYLLEKSRLVNHASGEKNFHIFYYLFAGLSEEKLSANLLSAPEQHRIMQEVDGGSVYKDDERRGECRRMWSVLQALMTRVGFKSYDVEGIEAILTAILHISDIRFLLDQETDGVSIINEEKSCQASQLLAVDEENLVNALLLTISIVNNEKITSLKNETQANDCRDALCKALYGRMFSWIVLQINKLLAPNLDRNYMEELEWIGILDIYGFENFRLNSFEQLCINIANEQLQLFFNQHIFKLELAEYAKEGIDGKDINFVDNQPLLDLFLEPKNPPGLFALLDEETKFPRATDHSLIYKLNDNLKNHPNYQSTKGQSLNFTIKHFAGPVTYNVNGFLEKNRDTLSVNLIDCLKESESVLVNDLFSPLTEIGGTLYKNTQTANRKNLRMSKMVVAGSKVRKGKISSLDMLKRASRMVHQSERSQMRSQENYTKDSSVRAAKTLATHFSSSLCELITKMTSAQPHFIRCIKPNAHKMPGDFEDGMVLRQLNYSGVLETIVIRKQGFASRIPFENFVYRYGLIVGMMSGGGAAPKSACEKVMKHAQLTDWRLGKSKIFLKHYHVERLDALYREASGPIVVCQQMWKCALARKKLKDLREAAKIYKLQAEKLSLSCQNNAQKFLSELTNEANKKSNNTNNGPPKQMSKLAEMSLANEENKKKVEKRKLRRTMSPTLRAAALKELDNMECILENETTNSSRIFPKGKQFFLPPIYRNIKSTSSDPTYVFLHESLGKFNTLTSDIWGKLYFMEKNAIIGKLYVKDDQILINDSQENYTGSNIGVNAPAFEHLPNEEVKKTISNIGKGITLARDGQNNVYITKHSDLDVYIYGAHDPDKHCFPQTINKRNSKLSLESTMLFDAEVFRTKVCNELKKTPPNVSKIVGLSCFSFSFEKQAPKQVDLPVWACFINFSALDTLGKTEVLTKSIEDGLLNDDSYTRNLWKQLDFNRS